MSLPVRTGRATIASGCRWCGADTETVAYEIRDPKTDGIGDEIMCCTCGRHQWCWGISSVWSGAQERYDRELAAEIHRDVLRDLAVTAWFAARLLGAAPAIPHPVHYPTPPASAPAALF